MVLLQHTCTIEIKEWVPSYELLQTNFIKKKDQPHMQLLNRELIIDMIAYITVNNKQLNTLSWALCMKIKTLYVRDRQLISMSFRAC